VIKRSLIDDPKCAHRHRHGRGRRFRPAGEWAERTLTIARRSCPSH
jgi:hypothetical protein